MAFWVIICTGTWIVDAFRPYFRSLSITSFEGKKKKRKTLKWNSLRFWWRPISSFIRHAQRDNKYIYPNIQFVQMLISPKCPSTVCAKCLSFEPRYPTNCLSPFAFSDQWKTNDNKKTTCAFVSRGSIFGQSFQTQFHLKNIQTYSWAKWDNKLDHWIVEGKSPRGNCCSFSSIEIVNFIWPIDFYAKCPAVSS